MFPNYIKIEASAVPDGFGVVHIAGISTHRPTLSSWRASQVIGSTVRHLEENHELKVVHRDEIGATLKTRSGTTLRVGDFYVLLAKPPVLREGNVDG